MNIPNRHAADYLVTFCIAQHHAFDENDWMSRSRIDGAAVALAARYLSMTSWYGHEDELHRIAENFPFLDEHSSSLHRASRALGFDLPTFAAKVRRGVALSSELVSGLVGEAEAAGAGAGPDAVRSEAR